MTDRYRYLPCDLHPALGASCGAPGVVSLIGGAYRPPHIDLTHPAGWDHAVRAYAAIRGGSVDESSSVSFEWTACGWELVGARVPPQPEMRFPGVRFESPFGRREALCRCICAALNLNPDEVFPDV